MMEADSISAQLLAEVATPALTALSAGLIDSDAAVQSVDANCSAIVESCASAALHEQKGAATAQSTCSPAADGVPNSEPTPQAFASVRSVPDLAKYAVEQTTRLTSSIRLPAWPELESGVCTCCGSTTTLECVKTQLTAAAKVFAAAYGGKGAIALLFTLLTGRLSLRQVRNAFGNDTLRFGSFVGLASTLARATRCTLAQLRGTDDKLNALLAGAISGLSIFVDAPTRRKDVALYLFVRSLYSSCQTFMRVGALPDLRGTIATHLLFGVANAFIIYGFIHEPQLLDASYYKWILNVAGLPHEVLQWTIRDGTWARMRASQQLADPHQGHHSGHNNQLSWPKPGEGSFGIGPCNPERTHGSMLGRVDLPAVRIDDAASTAGAQGALGDKRQLAWTSNTDGIPPHIDASTSDSLRQLSTSLFTNNKQFVEKAVSQGHSDGHLHADLLSRDPKWLHAAMVQTIQDPRAYRRCDTVWHSSRPCAFAHTHDSGPVAARCLKVYAPVHLIPLLLFKRKQLLDSPVVALAKAGRGIALSTGFLTSFVWMVKTALCTLRTTRMRDDRWQPLVAGFLSFPSLMLESRQRASELMLYCVTKGLRVAFSLAELRGAVRRLPHSEVLLFSIAMALMMLTDRRDLKSMWSSGLRFIVGDDKTSVADIPAIMRAVTALLRLRKRVAWVATRPWR